VETASSSSFKLQRDVFGYPKFSVPTLSPHWQQPDTDTDMVISIMIPGGTSFLDAKKILHFHHLSSTLKVEEALTLQRQAECKEASKKSVFVQSCVAETAQYNQALSKLGLDFEGENISVTGTNEVDVSVQAVKVWRKNVDKLAVGLVKNRKLRL